LGTEIKFSEYKYVHTVDHHKSEKRHELIPNIKDIFQSPDEIWAYRNKGKLDTIYIKFYEDYPYVITTSDDAVDNFYRADKGGKLNPLTEGLRQGTLLFRKI